jgi:RNA recognition motif-containing protein
MNSSTIGCTLFIGNLSWSVKDEDLKDHFQDVCFVVTSKVIEFKVYA